MEEHENLTPEPPRKSNKKILWVVLAAVLFIIFGFVAFYAVSKPPTKTTVVNSNADVQVLSEEEQEKFKYEAKVEISSGGFVPESLTIKKETRVSWQNSDSSDHEVIVSADSKDKPTSFGIPNGSVAPAGASYAYSFHQTGTFRFRDANNPEAEPMEIVVEE